MMFPAVVPRDESEEQVGKRGGPDPPADGVFVATEEIRQLKRLLDLLEEDLDSPSALIELTVRHASVQVSADTPFTRRTIVYCLKKVGN